MNYNPRLNECQIRERKQLFLDVFEFEHRYASKSLQQVIRLIGSGFRVELKLQDGRYKGRREPERPLKENPGTVILTMFDKALAGGEWPEHDALEDQFSPARVAHLYHMDWWGRRRYYLALEREVEAANPTEYIDTATDTESDDEPLDQDPPSGNPLPTASHEESRLPVQGDGEAAVSEGKKREREEGEEDEGEHERAVKKRNVGGA